MSFSAGHYRKESFGPISMSDRAAIVMQTILGALRLHWLGAELTGSPIDVILLWDFLSARWATTTRRKWRRRHLVSCLTTSGCGPAPGEFAMTIPVSPQVVNTSGALQGGLIATLIDVAGEHFGVQHLHEGTTMTTADMNIRYLRPIRQGMAVRGATDAAQRPARDGDAGRCPPRARAVGGGRVNQRGSSAGG